MFDGTVSYGGEDERRGERIECWLLSNQQASGIVILHAHLTVSSVCLLCLCLCADTMLAHLIEWLPITEDDDEAKYIYTFLVERIQA